MAYDPVKPYQLVCWFPGIPAANAFVAWTCPGSDAVPNPRGAGLYSLPLGVVFPGNFTNSVGRAFTLPTASATFTVNKIPAGSTTPTQFGTVVISTAGVFTFSTTSGLPETFVAGDTLTMVAPGTPDATLADVQVTLAGAR